jgi:hypothetical protein
LLSRARVGVATDGDGGGGGGGVARVLKSNTENRRSRSKG